MGKLRAFAIAGAWASLDQARAAGVPLDAILLDEGAGSRQGARPRTPALSSRERQVLELLASGCRDKELPARLGVSAHTARTFLRRALSKLNASSRTEAVARWLREGANGEL